MVFLLATVSTGILLGQVLAAKVDLLVVTTPIEIRDEKASAFRAGCQTCMSEALEQCADALRSH